MRKKIFTALVAVLSAFVLFPKAQSVTAFANSAQRYFFGSDASGVIFRGEESPIVVERETLTFDLSEFPKSYYESNEEFAEYSGRVEARYTFFNPSEYTVTADLLFPFGYAPSYLAYEYDDDGIGVVFADDTDKYDITIDGEPIKKTIRHTYSEIRESLDITEELDKLCDDYKADEFFSPDMTVTKYIYTAEALPDYGFFVSFDVAASDGETVFCFPRWNALHIFDDVYRKGVFVSSDSELELYAIGRPLSEPSGSDPTRWGFYTGNGGAWDAEKINGSVNLKRVETMTFKEFALKSREGTSAISDIDFYNAMLTNIRSSFNETYGVTEYEPDYPFYSNGLIYHFMRWYEYEITLAPNQRIVNTVTAPIYPDIDGGWSSDVYNYNYLLSPAKTFRSFGELEIIINTPFFLTDNSLGEFTKTDTGYVYNTDMLPETELAFTLCAEEEPASLFRAVSLVILIFLLIVSLILIAAIVTGIVLAIVFTRRKTRQ